MPVKMTQHFLGSLVKLTAQEQGQVNGFLEGFLRNPAAGTKLHPLEKCKPSSNLWSARVSRDIRVILHKQGDLWGILYVDHHKPAYGWAETRKVTRTSNGNGGLHIVNVVETIKNVERVIEKSVLPSPPPFFENESNEYLLSLGIPPDWLPTLRKAVTQEEAYKICEKLPPEIGDKLLAVATGELVTPTLDSSSQGTPDPFKKGLEEWFQVMFNTFEQGHEIKVKDPAAFNCVKEEGERIAWKLVTEEKDLEQAVVLFEDTLVDGTLVPVVIGETYLKSLGYVDPKRTLKAHLDKGRAEVHYHGSQCHLFNESQLLNLSLGLDFVKFSTSTVSNLFDSWRKAVFTKREYQLSQQVTQKVNGGSAKEATKQKEKLQALEQQLKEEKEKRQALAEQFKKWQIQQDRKDIQEKKDRQNLEKKLKKEKKSRKVFEEAYEETLEGLENAKQFQEAMEILEEGREDLKKKLEEEQKARKALEEEIQALEQHQSNIEMQGHLFWEVLEKSDWLESWENVMSFLAGHWPAHFYPELPLLDFYKKLQDLTYDHSLEVSSKADPHLIDALSALLRAQWIQWTLSRENERRNRENDR
jgi:hypothetical protein